MSEQRITEADLRAFEGAVNDLSALTDREDAPAIHMAVRVFAEVRRLRGIIASFRFSEPAEGVLNCEGGDWRGLLAEARAIREEQKP